MLEEYKERSAWNDHLDSVHIRSDILVTNRVLALLGDVRGKRILDAGCGNGKMSRLLEKAGASVVGVDVVPEQIDRARRASPETIRYEVGDLVHLDELDLPGDFDLAISLMTFLHLDSVQFGQALKQIKGLLKKGGTFVWADVHPGRYPEGERIEGALPTVDGRKIDLTFFSHSRAFIYEAFAEAGFEIVRTSEPLPTQ